MCTLSFIPKSDGYVLAMNRDELLARGRALPPHVRTIDGMSVVFPTDVAGGTWIAANQQGTTWALLNWNLSMKSVKERSRGEIVLDVASSSRPRVVERRISLRELKGADPFRMIGISAEFREISEWRWDGKSLDEGVHPWQPNHWFSSGISDSLAAESRSRTFASAWYEPTAGSQAWLRRMHASHEPELGAFSVCVHRDAAATVSYTEVEVDSGNVRMLYRPGSPCAAAGLIEIKLIREHPNPAPVL